MSTSVAAPNTNTPDPKAVAVRSLERWAPVACVESRCSARCRSVSRQAAYDVSDPTRAEVSFDGLVKTSRGCETTVSVRYMNGRGTARLAFLANGPEFVWRGPTATGPFDRPAFAKLKAMRINASGICSDSVFLRRAFLDSIGRLPEPEEARSFLADDDLAQFGFFLFHLSLG